MLVSIEQVNEQFFRKFFGLVIPIKGKDTKLHCRYAKKSSYDYAEEQSQQIYPCVAIQDYSPVPKEEWFIDMHAYFGGKSLDGLKGYLYQRPIWMNFKYDVSIVSKSYNEYMAIQNFFIQNFVYGKKFLFNQHFEGENMVGDVVPYEVRDTDIPRTDGVFETNYEFNCSVWLYPRTPEEVDLIQDIVINMENKGLPKDSGESEGILIVEDTTIGEVPPEGKSIVVKYVNGGSKDYTLTFVGDYRIPEEQNSFVLPVGGYAEVNYSNLSGGIVRIRGVITDKENRKKEIIVEQVGGNWILKEGVWVDHDVWIDSENWKDSADN